MIRNVVRDCVRNIVNDVTMRYGLPKGALKATDTGFVLKATDTKEILRANT